MFKTRYDYSRNLKFGTLVGTHISFQKMQHLVLLLLNTPFSTPPKFC